jgi:hypothetical protein
MGTLMRPIHLRQLVLPALFLVFLSGCHDDETAEEKNRKVRPNDYLSAETYTSLTVDVVYVEGLEPTATTVQALKSYLESVLNKPSGINVVLRSIPSPGAGIYSVETLKQVEFDQRTENTDGERLTAFIFFADGEYVNSTENSKILGVAYDYSSMAIFAQSVHDNSGGPGKPSTAKLETTAVNHEFSHILGLVNNGTPMTVDHHDNAHDGHCTNENCLMYYLAESSEIVPDLFGTATPVLDADCRADLVANGGKQ